MINTDEFIKRLTTLLEYYHLTASSFADTIGVQRSAISHLLSGRNKPSLELLLKITNTFSEANLEWLAAGKGQFPSQVNNERIEETKKSSASPLPVQELKVARITVFYTNGTFQNFIPEK